MTTEEELERFILEQEDKYKRYMLDPLETVKGAKEILQRACKSDGEFDPGSLKNEEAHNLHKKVAKFLFDKEYTSAALEFLMNWWNELGKRQSNVTDKHIHRAITSMQLVDYYLQLKDKGAALHWALLTHADDILDGISKGGAGKQKLRAVLGMTDEELKAFEKVAEENRQLIIGDQSDIDWASPEGFAEDVIVRFALENPGFAHLLAQETFTSEFPLSSGYFEKLRKRAEVQVTSKDNPTGITTTEKGKRLEYLASYLFLLIPGWIPLRNREDPYKTFENDIVVRNFNQSTYIADLVGRHFLVECKNWNTQKVKSPHAGYFLYRLQLTHAQFGVIFSWQGITGDGSMEPEERNARNLIRKAFHENGSVCIIVDKSCLEKLEEGETTFWPLLLELIEEFRFGSEKKFDSG